MEAQDAMIAFSLVIGLIAAVFVTWFICAAFVGLRDWISERRITKARRIRNQDLDSAYSTGQFQIPRQMRDWK